MLKKIGISLMIVTMIVVFSISSFAATKGTIGIAGWGQNNPFFVLLHDSAKKVFEDAGYEVIISDGQTLV
jgi:ABC-type sugar transport system substrate-binding protein